MRSIAFVAALLLAVPAVAGDADLTVYPEDAVPPSLKLGPAGKSLTAAELKDLKDGEILTALIDVPSNPVKKGIGVAVVDAKPAKVFAQLGDYANLKDFMPYVKKTTVDAVEGNVTTVSFVLEFPLGLAGRNYQLKLTDGPKEYDGVKVLVSEWVYTGKGNIIDTTGQWELAPWGTDKTLVRYTVFTDPGGSFPNWIKNKASKTALTNVITAVRDRVKSKDAKEPPAE